MGDITGFDKGEYAVKRCDDYGIVPRCSLMIEVPGESMEDIKKTIAFVKKLRKYHHFTCGVQIFRPYPKCELTDRMIKEGLFREPESFIEWTDIARQSGQAALHAAAFSAALAAAPHIWDTINEYIEAGEVDVGALADRGQAVLFTTSTAGLRGGVAAGITAACKSGLLGESVKSISPPAIGMATTMTLNAIGYSIKLQQGRITSQQFAHNCVRDTFALSAGMSGSLLGQIMIPMPVLGALAGNIVGSTLGSVVFEGSKHVIMGVCEESGWTFFRLVDQDFVVSDEVLQLCGYDLFSKRSFQTQSFSTSSFNVRSFTCNSLSFQPVRRGVIKFSAIGYI